MDEVVNAARNILDIIIPSYRFDENANYLEQVAALQYPGNWKINIIIIGDNPNVKIPASLQQLIDEKKIIFILNEKNMGMNSARNKGLDLSSGDWVLFLDDDIIPAKNLLFAYISAIEKKPGAMGFAGVVNFPKADNDFTKALAVSGYTHFFSLAKNKTTMPWGVSANVLFNRKKIGGIRFSPEFGNKGGGDEVDFSVQLKRQYNEELIAVPEAEVLHPWWHEGQVNYSRPFYYSRGNYLLLKKYPQYGNYHFLNCIELVLIALIFFPVIIIAGISWIKWLLWIVTLIFIDLLIHSIRILKENKEVTGKILLYAWFIKLAGQVGYTSVCLQKFYWQGLLKKFDIELREKKSNFHTNKWIIIKILLITVSALLIFLYQK